MQPQQAGQRPAQRRLTRSEMLEVPTLDGVRLMRAGDIADTTVQEFNEMRQVCSLMVLKQTMTACTSICCLVCTAHAGR